MSQNEKGGSDLDIFEALGKKSPSTRAAGTKTVPPPPPPTQASVRPAADNTKQTLLGLSVPPSVTSAIAAASPALRTPPPPPGRASLPPVVGPPGKASNGPATPNPGAKGSTAAVDVNWDDEDEATHIFDEAHEVPKAAAAASAPPSAPGPAPATTSAPAPSAARNQKATLLGMAVASSAAQPPSASSRAAMLSPGMTHSGYPAPGSSSLPPGPIGGLPPPPATQPGLGLGYPSRSLPPPPQGASAHPAPLGMAMPTPFPRQAPPPDYLLAQTQGMEATALLRAPQQRTALWVALGLAAVAVLGVAWLYGGAPHTGRIVVNATDTKGASVNRVEIFLDGRKVQCDTAPCIIDTVTSGSHDVKVLADGFEAPAVQTVMVEGHKDSSSIFTLGSAKGSGVKVSGTQPGVKLYVDDKEVGPLPEEVHDLAPGDHVIKVAGSERYQALEKHVTVEKDQVEDLGAITLKVLKGKATITPGTSGARVYLVSGTDRRELPMLPISVDIDTAKNWSLEATKVGFDDFKQPISFDDGQAEKTVVVTLDAHAAGAAPVYAPAPQQVAAAPAPQPAPAPAPQPAPAAAAGASEGGEAFLNINSIPPSTCFLDGRSLGSTPRVHVSVKPGSHTVKFINADQGLTKTLSISVGAGETKPAVAKLN